MKNKRNTRRGRAKRSTARPGMWFVVWYSPECNVRFVTHRREAFKVVEAIVRGLR